MSRLTNWLLIPPVSSRLSERYRHYRHHGASSLSAALGCFWMILAWMFIPLEHPRWQRIRARHGELYPHINPDKPRPLDPARYAIQSIWLLATSTGAEKKTSRWRSFDRVQNLREHYHQWLNRLPDRVGDRTGHLDNHKELGHLHPGLRRFILGVVVVFSLILALVCITQPFNPLAVYLPDPAVGRGAAGAVHSGAFFCPDADRAVADRFLPLHLVAIYLNAELGRSGQPGVWVSAAVR